METLEKKLSYEINCLVEGLESKEQVLENIQNYIESEYISKGTLKKALDQLANVPKMIRHWLDNLTIEEAMELYNSKGVSFICSNGRVRHADMETTDIPIEDAQINYIYQRRAN